MGVDIRTLLRFESDDLRAAAFKENATSVDEGGKTKGGNKMKEHAVKQKAKGNGLEERPSNRQRRHGRHPWRRDDRRGGRRDNRERSRRRSRERSPTRRRASSKRHPSPRKAPKKKRLIQMSLFFLPPRCSRVRPIPAIIPPLFAFW